jgi:hypothetical protein
MKAGEKKKKSEVEFLRTTPTQKPKLFKNKFWKKSNLIRSKTSIMFTIQSFIKKYSK